MARFKDVEWAVREAEGSRHSAANCEEAILAVLMDLRDELKRLNVTLNCPNTIAIPNLLRRIARNTTKKKRK